MYNIRLKPVLLAPRIRIVHFYIRRKLEIIRCFAIHNFSVWLRTGSNPVDINRFPSDIGKYILKYTIYSIL